MASGPYEEIEIGDGRTAPLYLLRYDKDGRLLSPKAEQAVREASAGASDVFVFAHGWNNVFGVALERYRSFIEGYARQRTTFGLPFPPGYRPVLVGVVWPSTSVVFPWEKGPTIAALPAPGTPGGDEDARATEEMLALVTEDMAPADAAAFTELIDARRPLEPDAAREAARLVLAATAEPDADTGAEPPDITTVLDVWRRLGGGAAAAVSDDDDFGTVEDDVGAPDDAAGAGPGPQAAGVTLDPRELLRLGTVWTMKGRAGRVGVNGVRPLLEHLLGRDAGPRVHLIGHSFGARLVLSALATANVARPARSMLLLQAAVNRWCFAAEVPGTGRRGGYADVPGRVDLPILATFSPHDLPLRQAFHLALRTSLGELNVAAVGEPELYGALGGYGPAGLGAAAVSRPAARPGVGDYPLTGSARVIAVDGGTRFAAQGGGDKPAIGGHGDISNAATWWALHCLTAAG